MRICMNSDLVMDFALLLILLPALVEPIKDSCDYSTSWAVKIDGGSQEADRLASAHGFLNRGQVGSLSNHYHFELEGNLHQPMSHKTEALLQDVKVKYAEQQCIRSHVKRDYVIPMDPGWPKEWCLKNTGQTGSSVRLDSRVEQAWLQGYTGQGIVVAVVDDGLEWKHHDLIDNYDAQLSYDFIDKDNDSTPEDGNNHGTECAGVIAMSKNVVCGIGVAYGSKVAGLKTEIEESMDVYEASSLGHRQDNIHIYSNSWGPKDNGFTVEDIGPLVAKIFENGAKKGRGQKGNIYVWAAGNGGDHHDSCAADGFVNSIYTIAVGSADQDGRQADYDEDCSAKMAVTFSYNSNPGVQMYTTTLNGQCTEGFTGTSASAPEAAGIIALVLQANPDLTWRDVQYLIAYTSNPDILTGDDWVANAAGLKVSHHFGFGAIDAEAMVTRARHWINVPEQHNITIPAMPFRCNVSSESSSLVHFINANSLPESESGITSLEHVVVTLSLSVTSSEVFNLTDYYDAVDDESIDISEWLESPHPQRGDVKIELTSPAGTKSILLPYRNYDFVNEEGYDNWPFMSLHFWGENPVGTWTLQTAYKSSAGSVYVGNISMTLFGVVESLNKTNQSTCSLCSRGCGVICDVCRELRDNISLACVSACPNGTTEYNGYCIEGEVIYTPSSGSTTTHSSSVISILISVTVTFLASVTIVIIVTVLVLVKRKRKHSANAGVNYRRLAFVDNEEIAQV